MQNYKVNVIDKKSLPAVLIISIQDNRGICENVYLKSKTGLNVESGYYKTVGNSSIFSQGTPGNSSWNNPSPSSLPNKSLQRVLHNHYATEGTFSIFSGADLMVFSDYVGLDKVANDFTFSLTTSQGLSYTYVIEDKVKFDAFYEKYGTGTFRNTLVSLFDGAGRPANSTPIQNEDKVLFYLNMLNSGIALLKSNSDFTTWNKLKRGTNNNVINDPCN